MNASALDKFIGMSLKSVSSSDSELVLTFDRARLTCFNRHVFSGSQPIGEKVQSVLFKEYEVVSLIFSDGGHFELSLAGHDYIGPEAFCATFADGTIVVE